jgi:hypothetical protein
LWNDFLNPAAAVPIQRSAFQTQAVATPWLGENGYKVKKVTT